MDKSVRSIYMASSRVIGDVLYFRYQTDEGWKLGVAKNWKFRGNLFDKPVRDIDMKSSKVVGDVLYFEYSTNEGDKLGVVKNEKFKINILGKPMRFIYMNCSRVVGDFLYFKYKTDKGCNAGAAKNGKFMGNLLNKPVRDIYMEYSKVVRDVLYFGYDVDEGLASLVTAKNGKFEYLFCTPVRNMMYIDYSKVVGDVFYFKYQNYYSNWKLGWKLGVVKKGGSMRNLLDKPMRNIDMLDSKVIGDVFYFKYQTDKGWKLGAAKNWKFRGNILDMPMRFSRNLLDKAVRSIYMKESKVVGDILYFPYKTDEDWSLNLGAAKNKKFMGNIFDNPVRYINIKSSKVIGDILYFPHKTNEGKNTAMIQNGKFIRNTSEIPTFMPKATKRYILEEEKSMNIDERVWNRHKDTIIHNIKKQQLQYLKDNYIRELGRLKTYDQISLYILLNKKKEYADLIHYLSMYLASDEMERAGEILGELNDEILEFLLIIFNCNMDDTTVANDFKNMLSKGSKLETKAAFRKYIIDICYKKGLALEKQIEIESDINLEDVSLPSEIERYITSFIYNLKGWNRYISGNTNNIKEKIKRYHIFKGDEMITASKSLAKYYKKKKLNNLDDWHEFWEDIDKRREETSKSLNKNIRIIDIILLFQGFKDIILDGFILKKDHWGFRFMNSLKNLATKKDISLNVIMIPETPQKGEKRRYIKEINKSGIKTLVRHIEYQDGREEIIFIIPPGLEELGYASWKKMTKAIEKLGTGISVNLFLRDLIIFVQELKTTPNLRPSIHKSLLNAA